MIPFKSTSEWDRLLFYTVAARRVQLINRSFKLFVYCLLSTALAACTNSCSTSDTTQSWEERYASMDIPSTEPLTPQQALESFRLAPGIEMDLVASEPLIGDPVAMEWDEFGRLYVVEMRGYMRDSYGTDETEPFGRVVRLTDRDNDGQMDVSEVFLEGLVNPRALAIVNAGIVIAEPPNLWLCALPEKNSVCDNKVRLGDYGNGNPDDVEHDENRLLLAMNGWLYSAKSDVKRRIDDQGLTSKPTFYRGQWGMSEDHQGRLFYNNNSTLVQGDYFPADYYHRFRYSDLGLDANLGLAELLLNDQSVYTIRVNPGVNRAYSEGVLRDDHRLNVATGASGLQIYYGTQLPVAWQGNAFVSESAGNVVAQVAINAQNIALEAQHITYPDEQWGEREFLGSTDERFRPVDMRLGPDGALYVIDMYRGIIQHRNFITDQLRAQSEERGLDTPIGLGRIYRLRSKDAPNIAPTDFTTAQGLLSALAHSEVWPRQTAARLLRKAEYRADVADLDLSQLPEDAQPRALWLKQLTGVLTESDLNSALNTPGAMRINAMKMARTVMSPETLLRWYKKQSLTEQEQLHMLATFGQWPNDSLAIAQRRILLADNIDSPYFRRVYLSSLGSDGLAELAHWLSVDSLAASQSGQALLQDVTMTAFLDSKSMGIANANTEATESVLGFIQQAHATSPATAIRAMLKGIVAATKQKDFEAVQLAARPAILEPQSLGSDKSVNEMLYHSRQAFSFPDDDFVAGLQPLTEQQALLAKRGEAVYSSCAVCHQPSGAGLEGVAPPLAESEWVSGPPEWLARIVLHGVAGPIEVAGKEWNQIMPGHGHLDLFDDDAIAGLMTFMRRNWGNKAGAVEPELVAAARAASAERRQPWTVEELRQVPVASPFSKYAGEYKIPFMPISFNVKAMPDHIVLDSPQGQAALKPDLDGVFAIEDMGVTFFFVEEGDDVILKFTRGKDQIDMKRRDPD